MELSADYTPEISDFKVCCQSKSSAGPESFAKPTKLAKPHATQEGTVVAYSASNGVVRIQLAPRFVPPPPDYSEDAAVGRFEMDLDDTVTVGVSDQVPSRKRVACAQSQTNCSAFSRFFLQVEVDYQLLIEPRVWR